MSHAIMIGCRIWYQRRSIVTLDKLTPHQMIQEATASEPLTLDEEYAMQRSWRRDNDKLTFIVCLPIEIDNQSKPQVTGRHEVMLGDVNMFISLSDESTPEQPMVIGELEVMIAKRDQQHRGFGKAALLTFLQYVVLHQQAILVEFSQSASDAFVPSPFAYFAAKIGKDNARSLALFGGLGFENTKEEPNYWGEFELRHYDLTSADVEKMMTDNGIHQYDEMDYED